MDHVTKLDNLPYPILIGTGATEGIRDFMEPYGKEGIFILADKNTVKSCLPYLLNRVPELKDKPVFSVSAGEISKNHGSLAALWEWLLNNSASKSSLLVNLGGGVVTDLGGFVAASFKRGIAYINIPTSLIAQADAAIGGKTGINISGIKNQAGIFYDPEAVFIDPVFLATLPEDHYRSGLSEILKCALLSGTTSWEQFKDYIKNGDNRIEHLLVETVKFKAGVVLSDPLDQNSRKMLNFGHTVGHALEGKAQVGILHGEAVAAGMICGAYLSHEISGLAKHIVDEITAVIAGIFNLKPIEGNQFAELLDVMGHDKKARGGQILFTLLEDIGKPVLEIPVSRDKIIRSINFLNSVI